MSTGRRIWTLAIAGLMALAFTFVLSSSATSKAPPKDHVIKICKTKKSAVKFPHAAHVKKLKAKGVKCATCHHKKSADKTCGTAKCHAKPQKGVAACTKASKKNAYHVSCIGCHKKMAKGPTKCKQCHK